MKPWERDQSDFPMPTGARFTDGLSNTIAFAERYTMGWGDDRIQVRFTE